MITSATCKLEIVHGFSSDTVFFIHNHHSFPCGFDGGFIKDSEGETICTVTETPLKQFWTARSLEELWFKFSGPKDIRNYRSPSQIACGFGYEFSTDEHEKSTARIDLNIKFDDSYVIYLLHGSQQDEICRGHFDKSAWDLNYLDISKVMDKAEAQIINYLNNNTLQPA